MRHGVLTTTTPNRPDCLYMRSMYHEFFWGPFADEAQLTAAVLCLDDADPMWDYDPFCIHYGADPLPLDFVFGFRLAPDDMRTRLEAARHQHKTTKK